jgi:thiosulfate/3-mercaptopyruvate sulfurtransferase
MRSAGGAVKFLNPVAYRALMTQRGIDPAAPPLTHCSNGHLSSGPWLVQSELLGNREARLYDGSLHEWTLEGRPLSGAVPLQ